MRFWKSKTERDAESRKVATEQAKVKAAAEAAEAERRKKDWERELAAIRTEIDDAVKAGKRFINLGYRNISAVVFIANEDKRVVSVQLHSYYIPLQGGGWVKPIGALLTLQRDASVVAKAA